MLALLWFAKTVLKNDWLIARSKTLAKLAMDWQDLLRKAAAAGDD